MLVSRRKFVQASVAVSAGTMGGPADARSFAVGQGVQSGLPAAIGALKPFPGKPTPIADAERLARIEKARRLMSEQGMGAIVLEPGTS
ncbi:MAG: M24 family metallopeptidase, partial [Vicinamibacterales bacterium]